MSQHFKILTDKKLFNGCPQSSLHSYAAEFCLANCRSSKRVIKNNNICSVVARKSGLIFSSSLAILCDSDAAPRAFLQ